MAYRVRCYIDIDWVGDGGGTVLGGGISQANNPGFTGADGSGSVGVAQTRRYQTSEQIPGGDAPTLANILTALQSCASDFAAASGTVKITAAELALIQAWATGGP
jgi:hypothetical protein